MINFRSHFAIKVISIILIAAFLSLDISWAHPEDGTPRQPSASTLALPSVGQTQPVNEFAAELQASVLAERGLVVAIYDIAKYLMGDDLHKIGQLPEQHIEGALFRRLKTYRALYGIDLSHVRFKDGVITMLYNPPDGKKSLIYISEKDNLAIRELAGYDWVIGDKYAVKVLPEDYDERETQDARRKTSVAGSVEERETLDVRRETSVEEREMGDEGDPSLHSGRFAEEADGKSRETTVEDRKTQDVRGETLDVRRETSSPSLRGVPPEAERRSNLTDDKQVTISEPIAQVSHQLAPEKTISIRKIIASSLIMMLVALPAFAEGVTGIDMWSVKFVMTLVISVFLGAGIGGLLAFLFLGLPLMASRSFSQIKTDDSVSTAQPTVVRIADDFKEVSGLGGNIPVAFVVKGVNSPELKARRIGIHKDTGKLYEPARPISEPTSLFIMTVNDIAETSRSLWEISGVEPRDIAVRDDVIAVVFSEEIIIIDTSTKEIKKRIRNPEFKLLHTVKFHPADPGLILVASTGLDRILEVDIVSGNVVYEWLAWENGYGKNKFGMTLTEKDRPIAGFSDTTVLSREEYIRRFENKVREDLKPGQDYRVVIDISKVDSPVGLERAFYGAGPNWADYGRDGNTIMATLFDPGQLIEIEKATGRTRIVLKDLNKPHGAIYYNGGYILSDSQNGRVILLDKDYKVAKIYDFSGLPFVNGDNYVVDWLQNSYPIGDGSLIATVDGRRAVIYVWDPDRKEYASYPYRSDWLVQSVLSINVKPFLKKGEGSAVPNSEKTGLDTYPPNTTVPAEAVIDQVPLLDRTYENMPALIDGTELDRLDGARKTAVENLTRIMQGGEGDMEKAIDEIRTIDSGIDRLFEDTSNIIRNTNYEQDPSLRSGRFAEEVDGKSRTTKLPVLLIATTAAMLASASAFAGESTSNFGTKTLSSIIHELFAAHPLGFVVVASMAGLALGTAAFFIIWRLFFPVRWHMWRLGSYEYGVPARAEEALVLLGTRATPRLLAGLSSRNKEVVVSSSRVLGKIKEVRAIAALISNLDSREHAIRRASAEALANIDVPAVQDLIKCFAAQNEYKRQLAAWSLGEIGDSRAVIPLVGLLKDPAEGVRKSAAEALGKIKDPRALESLIGLLAEVELHQTVVTAIINIQDPRRETLLIAALKNADEHIRAGAATILGRVKASTAVKALEPLIQDPSKAVRGKTAEALGAIGDKKAAPALVVALSDSDTVNRRIAADSLKKLEWKPVNKGEEIAYAVATGDWNKLGEVGAPAIPALKTLLSDEDANTRKSAVQTLGAIKDRSAFELINDALTDPDKGVANAAVTALGESGDIRAAEPLIAILADKSSRLDRAAAAASLGKIKDERSVIPLLSGVGDTDSRVRSASAGSLIAISNPLLASMVPYLSHVKEGSRTYGYSDDYAVMTLQQIELVTSFIEAAQAVRAEYIPPSTHEEEEEYYDVYGSPMQYSNTVLDKPAQLVLRLGGASSLPEAVHDRVAEAIRTGRLAPEYAPDVAPWELDAGTLDLSREGMVIRSIRSIADILKTRSWMWHSIADSKDKTDKAVSKIQIIRSKIPAVVATLYENGMISADKPLVSIYLMGSYAWSDSPNDIDIVVVVDGEKEFTRIASSKLKVTAKEIAPGLEANYEVVGLETLKKAARGEKLPMAQVIRRKLTAYSGAIPISGVDIFRRTLPPLDNYRVLGEDLFVDAQFARWEEIKGDAAKVEAKKRWRLSEIEALKKWLETRGRRSTPSLRAHSFIPFLLGGLAAMLASGLAAAQPSYFGGPSMGGHMPLPAGPTGTLPIQVTPYGAPLLSLGQLFIDGIIVTAIVFLASAIIWLIAKKVFKRDINPAKVGVPAVVFLMAPFHPVSFGVIVASFAYGYLDNYRPTLSRVMLKAVSYFRDHKFLGLTAYLFLTVLATEYFSYCSGFWLPLAGLSLLNIVMGNAFKRSVGEVSRMEKPVSEASSGEKPGLANKTARKDIGMPRSGEKISHPQALRLVKNWRSVEGDRLAASVEVLGQSGDKSVMKLLSPLAESGSSFVYRALIRAYQDLGATREELFQLHKDVLLKYYTSGYVAEEVVVELGNFGDPRAISLLEQYIDHGNFANGLYSDVEKPIIDAAKKLGADDGLLVELRTRITEKCIIHLRTSFRAAAIKALESDVCASILVSMGHDLQELIDSTMPDYVVGALERIESDKVHNQWGVGYEKERIAEAVKRVSDPGLVKSILNTLNVLDGNDANITSSQMDVIKECLKNGYDFTVEYVPAKTHEEEQEEYDAYGNSYGSTTVTITDAPAVLNVVKGQKRNKAGDVPQNGMEDRGMRDEGRGTTKNGPGTAGKLDILLVAMLASSGAWADGIATNIGATKILSTFYFAISSHPFITFMFVVPAITGVIAGLYSRRPHDSERNDLAMCLGLLPSLLFLVINFTIACATSLQTSHSGFEVVFSYIIGIFPGFLSACLMMLPVIATFFLMAGITGGKNWLHHEDLVRNSYEDNNNDTGYSDYSDSGYFDAYSGGGSSAGYWVPAEGAEEEIKDAPQEETATAEKPESPQGKSPGITGTLGIFLAAMLASGSAFAQSGSEAFNFSWFSVTPRTFLLVIAALVPSYITWRILSYILADNSGVVYQEDRATRSKKIAMKVMMRLAVIFLAISGLFSILPSHRAGDVDVKENAGDIAARISEATKYYTQGERAFEQDRYNDALTALNKAIEHNPDFDLAYNLRGICHLALGRVPGAISDFIKSLELNGRNDTAYKNLVAACGILGLDHPKAIYNFTKIIEFNPNNPDAYNNRGTCYFVAGRYPESLRDFSRAISIDPGYVNAYKMRGSIYFDILRDYPRAIQDLTKVIELSPENEIEASTYNNRGFSYVQGPGLLGLALYDFNKAIKIDPNFANAYYNRGLLYFAINMEDEGERDLRHAAKLDPRLRPMVDDALKGFKAIANAPAERKDAGSSGNLRGLAPMIAFLTAVFIAGSASAQAAGPFTESVQPVILNLSFAALKNFTFNHYVIFGVSVFLAVLIGVIIYQYIADASSSSRSASKGYGLIELSLRMRHLVAKEATFSNTAWEVAEGIKPMSPEIETADIWALAGSGEEKAFIDEHTFSVEENNGITDRVGYVAETESKWVRPAGPILCVCNSNYNRSPAMQMVLNHLINKNELSRYMKVSSGAAGDQSELGWGATNAPLAEAFRQEFGEEPVKVDSRPATLEEVREAAVIIFVNKGLQATLEARFPGELKDKTVIILDEVAEAAGIAEPQNAPSKDAAILNKVRRTIEKVIWPGLFVEIGKAGSVSDSGLTSRRTFVNIMLASLGLPALLGQTGCNKPNVINPVIAIMSQIPEITTSPVLTVDYTVDGEPRQTVFQLSEGLNTRVIVETNSSGGRAEYSFDIRLDTIPPTGVLTINGGEETTDSRSVTVNINARDSGSGLSALRFSLDGGENWTSWETPVTSKAMTLSEGDGIKEILCQAKDRAGLVSQFAGYIMLETLPPVPRSPSLAYAEEHDRRLFVRERLPDGTLGGEYSFVARGVNWSPHTKGAPVSTITQEFYKWYKADLSLMSRMGVNVARVYYDFGTGPEAFEILDAFYRMGIKLIMAVDSPRYGVVADMDNVRRVVEAYKDHPAILMWAIGNEWDINYYYGKFASGLDAADFTERAAQLIKSIDNNHPVSTVFADPHVPGYHVLSPEEFPLEMNGYAYTTDIVNTLVPSVDVWGLSIYRGTSMEDVFQQWRSISDKPIFISEFGADSFDHRIPDENEAMQAEVNGWLWDEIFFELSAERTAGTAIGGLVFELRDEWWKLGFPNHQDTSGENNSGQPDGRNDEEYFGVADIDGNPKEAFNALKDRFTKGQAAVALNSRPLLTATSHGDASFGIGEKTVYFRGGGGTGGRGINVAILDRNTGIRMKETRNFDTYGGDRANVESFIEFIDYMNSIPDGEIVLLAVADEGGFAGWGNTQFTDPVVEEARQLLESMGSTMIRGLQYNGSWSMIAIKGEGALAEDINNTPSHVEGGEAIAEALVDLDLDPDYGRRSDSVSKSGYDRQIGQNGYAAHMRILIFALLAAIFTSGPVFAEDVTRGAVVESGEGVLSAIWEQVSTHPQLAIAALALTAFLIMWNTNFWKWPLFRSSYYKSILNSQGSGSRSNYIRGMMWFAENNRFSPERLPVVFSHSDAAKILVAKKAMEALRLAGLPAHKARSLVLRRWQDVENAVAGKNGVARIVSSWDNMRLDPNRAGIMNLFDVEYRNGEIKVKSSSPASFDDEGPAGNVQAQYRPAGRGTDRRNILGTIGVLTAAMLFPGRAFAQDAAQDIFSDGILSSVFLHPIWLIFIPLLAVVYYLYVLPLHASLVADEFVISPSVLNVPDGERVKSTVDAIEIFAGEGRRPIVHLDRINNSGGRGNAIVQKGGKDTTDKITPRFLKDVLDECHRRELGVTPLFDLHIMDTDENVTKSYIAKYLDNCAGIVTLHWEGFEDKGKLLRLLRYIKSRGAMAGIALNPNTKIDSAGRFIMEHRQDIDIVLQMSVHPGLGNQKFIPSALSNIRRLRFYYGYDGPIEIDGGINGDTIKSALTAGANIFVAGSSFFRDGMMEAPQLEEAHNVLLAGMEEARPGSASPRRIEKRSYLGRWLAAIALFLGIASAVDLGATISYGQAILTGEKTAIIYDDGVQKEETLPLDISESAQSPEEIWNAILRQSEAATPPSLPAITGGSTSRKRKVLISGGGAGIQFFDDTFGGYGWSVRKAITPFDAGRSTGKIRRLLKDKLDIDSLALGDIAKAIVNRGPRKRKEILGHRFSKDELAGKGRKFSDIVEGLLIDQQKRGEKDPTLRSDLGWSDFSRNLLESAQAVDRLFPRMPLANHTVQNLALLGSILLEKGYGKGIFSAEGIQRGLDRFCRDIAGVEDVMVALPTSIDLNDSEMSISFADGSPSIVGQDEITNTRHEKVISELSFGNRREYPMAYERCIEEIDSLGEGDFYVLGPGSFYTSILVDLLPVGITDAIIRARERGAIAVFVFNPMYDNETDFMRAKNGINPYIYIYEQIEKHTGCDFGDLFTYCIVNDTAQTAKEVLDAMTVFPPVKGRSDKENVRNRRYGPIGTPGELDGFKSFIASRTKAPVIVSGEFMTRRDGGVTPERRATYDGGRFTKLFELFAHDMEEQKARSRTGFGKLISADTHGSPDSLDRLTKSNPGIDVWVVGDLLDRGSQFEEMMSLVDRFTLGDHDLWFLGASLGDEYSIALHVWMLERYPGQKRALKSMGIDLKRLENFAQGRYELGKLRNMELHMRLKGLSAYVNEKLGGDWERFYASLGELDKFAPEEKEAIEALSRSYRDLNTALIESVLGKLKKLEKESAVEKDVKKSVGYRGMSSVSEQAIFNIWVKVAVKRGVLKGEDLRALGVDEYIRDLSGELTKEEEDILSDLKRQFLNAQGVRNWARTLWHGKAWDIVSALPELRADKNEETQKWVRGLSFWRALNKPQRALLVHAIPAMNEDGWLVDLEGMPLVRLKGEDGGWRGDVTEDEKRSVLRYYEEVNANLEEFARRYDRFIATGRSDELFADLASGRIRDAYRWFIMISDGQYSPTFARRQARFYNSYVKNTSEPDNVTYDFLGIKKSKYSGTEEDQARLAALLCSIFDVDRIIVGHKSSTEEEVIDSFAGGLIVKADPGSTNKAGVSGALESTERGGAVIIGDDGAVKKVSLVKVADILKDKEGKYIARDGSENARDNLLSLINLRDLMYYKGANVEWEDLFKAPMLLRDLVYLLNVSGHPMDVPGVDRRVRWYGDEEWRSLAEAVSFGSRQRVVGELKAGLSAILGPVPGDGVDTECAERIRRYFDKLQEKDVFARDIFNRTPHRPRLPVVTRDLAAAPGEKGDISGYVDATEIGVGSQPGSSQSELGLRAASPEGWRNLYRPITAPKQSTLKGVLGILILAMTLAGPAFTEGFSFPIEKAQFEFNSAMFDFLYSYWFPAAMALIVAGMIVYVFLHHRSNSEQSTEIRRAEDGMMTQAVNGVSSQEKNISMRPVYPEAEEAKGPFRGDIQKAHKKYSPDGKPVFFEGVTVISSHPKRNYPLFRELTGVINNWPKENGRGFIATVASGSEHITLSDLICMSDWAGKYREKLNQETKDAINKRAVELIQKGGFRSEEKAREQAAYEVVTERVYEALRGFVADKAPVFVPESVVAFRPSGMTRPLIVRMKPKTEKDLAIVNRLRSLIEEATGISEPGGYKAHVTLGYLVNPISESREAFDSYVAMTEELDRIVRERADIPEDEFVMQDIELSYFASMDSFPAIETFSWTDGGSNSAKSGDPAEILRNIQNQKRATGESEPLSQDNSGLFAEIESYVNNVRAKMVKKANGLADVVNAMGQGGDVTSGKIESTGSTAEVMHRISEVITGASQKAKAGLSEDAARAMEELMEGLDEIEANGVFSSLIAQTRNAKQRKEKFLVGIGTGWIPAYDEMGSLQRNMTNRFLNEMKSIIYRKMTSWGLGDVEIITGSDNDVARELKLRVDVTGTSLSNVVAIASQESIEKSSAFAPLRSTDSEARAYLIGINPSRLLAAYEKYGESLDSQIDVDITHLLLTAVDFAASGELPNIPMVDNDRSDAVRRILIVTPSAIVEKYDDLKKINEGRKTTLASA